MECQEEEEEEEGSSLLSLSQTFLQADHSATSINQLHHWPNGSAGVAADISGHFSPVSPVESYCTNSNAGHMFTDSENSLRFYKPVLSQGAAKTSGMFSRSGVGNNSVSIPGSFSSSHRVNTNDFGHNSNHGGIENDENLCYKPSTDSRVNTDSYIAKGQGFAVKSVLSNISQPRDVTKLLNTHTSVYTDASSMMSLVSLSDKMNTSENQSLPLDQNSLTIRTKQDLYNQPSGKPLQVTELSFDRRDSSNLDGGFDLPSNMRDFTASGRMEMAAIGHGTPEFDYHQSQRYSPTQLGFTLEGHDEEAQSRGTPGTHKKNLYMHHFNDLSSDLEPVLQADFLGHQKPGQDAHRNFGLPEFPDSEDSVRFNVKSQTHVQSREVKSQTHAQSKESISKWNVRQRAHRKMARLLGSQGHRDYCCAVTSQTPNTRTAPILQSKNVYQQSSPTGSSTAFLTMEEELDLRTNHQHRHFLPRRNEVFDRHPGIQRDVGLMHTAPTFSCDSTSISGPSHTHKDPMSTNQQFVSSSQLDLDFHSSLSLAQTQKDLDLNQHFNLQVSKEFSLETAHTISNQDELPFDHSTDTQHVSQAELSLTDNLGIVSHVQQDLNLEAYFNSSCEKDLSSEKDLPFGRKFSRELNYSAANSGTEFNIEVYMNPQNQRDLSHSCLNRPELPQDMTVYPKSPADKLVLSETLGQFKSRDKTHNPMQCDKDRQGDMSELQKELTKTSTKESMKGIRIPRDINRAMEILQGLQEDEKEEERRKKQLEKQQQQGLASSPKKTFHNKHQIENVAVQQLLTTSESYLEDQTVGSFLDQPQLVISDQHSDSLQLVQSYQFSQLSQGPEVEVASSLSNKRDLPENLAQSMSSELDYHILKRLALTAALKDPNPAQNSSFSNNSSTSLASIFAGTSNPDTDVSFPMSGMAHFPSQVSVLDDVMDSPILPHTSQSMTEHIRSKHDMSLNFDFEPQQGIEDKSSFSGETTDPGLDTSVAMSFLNTGRADVEVVMSSRKKLYTMMKQELFCDAVLSTFKQSIKVHKAVLCSMSDYLTTLLHSLMSGTHNSSFTSTNSSQISCIVLGINCESIKASSVTAFLLYVYLGNVQLSQSNVVDMYMLACSLRVSTLKELCREFMWENHISEEQIKVPQLLVSKARLELQDQASMTEGEKKMYEDKGTNTVSAGKTLNVATQTDRSTSQTGEGGQEEWVMLKKTKQKTVSPSKSGILAWESPLALKPVKKGWLSPKRRYKTESQMDTRTGEKDSAPVEKTAANISNLLRGSVKMQEDCKTHEKSQIDEVSWSIRPAVTGQPEQEITEAPLESKRTTVEIAAAAAAAKLSAHSYGTRTAMGNAKSPVSYAALACGQEKRKSSVHKDKSVASLSKKKEFIQCNPETAFSPQQAYSSSQQLPKDSLVVVDGILPTEADKTTEKAAATSELSRPNLAMPKSSVKKPFKKSIVHRSQSDEVERSSAQPVSTISKKGDNQVPSRGEPTLGSESDFMDSNLIDSIVSTMDCESSDVDLQRVINDLDTLNKSPSLTTASVSLTSLTSPLKSPASSLSTPDWSSPLKARSTPQGFRKRLIQLMKSEKSNLSSLTQNPKVLSASATAQNTTVTTLTFPADRIPSPGRERSTSATITTDRIPSPGRERNTIITDKIPSPGRETSTSDADIPPLLLLDKEHALFADEISLTASFLAEETCSTSPDQLTTFSTLTDQALGLKNETGQPFLHKIYTKKKYKSRKMADAEIKVKLKQPVSSEIDGGSVAKGRQRKSDTEGMKMKLKKLLTNEPRHRKTGGSDTEGAGLRNKQAALTAKVRPPPKKRAKMELELLKAAADSQQKKEQDSSQAQEASHTRLLHSSPKPFRGQPDKNEAKPAREMGKSTSMDEKVVSQQLQTAGRGEKKSGCAQDKALAKGTLQTNMHTQATLMLEEQAKQMNLKNRQFTCRLCQTKVRSARRTIKHMSRHGLSGQEALDNISIGEKHSEQEACDICGYKSKDRSYQYIHYHKYFKHGVVLPLGWSTDKCHICGKECFNKFQLKEHMLTHEANDSYICWHCGQSFRQRNCLNSHVFHKHSDVRKHMCKACNKAFKTWTQLKVHVRSHTGERPFACSLCEHRSSTQGNLKLHLITHGYSRDQAQELLEKISKNEPDMDPETLDQIMTDIAQKVKAKKTEVKVKQENSQMLPVTSNLRPAGNLNVPAGGLWKRRKKCQEEKLDTVSKFAGSQIQRLLTEPLSEMKPPKLILPHLAGSTQDNTQVQGESAASDLHHLSFLLQQQTCRQEGSCLPATAFIIPLSQSDQQSFISALQQQQQQHQQAAVDPLSSLMSYTFISTHVLPAQAGNDVAVDTSSSSSSLSLPIYTSEILSSGLAVVQSQCQSVPLLTDDAAAAGGLSTSQDSVLVSDVSGFMGTCQGTELLQENSSVSLQDTNTANLLVTDSTSLPLTTQHFPAANSSSNNLEDSRILMVLPADVLRQQTQPIFTSSASSSSSMLLPDLHNVSSAHSSGPLAHVKNLPVESLQAGSLDPDPTVIDTTVNGMGSQ